MKGAERRNLVIPTIKQDNWKQTVSNKYALQTFIIDALYSAIQHIQRQTKEFVHSLVICN